MHHPFLVSLLLLFGASNGVYSLAPESSVQFEDFLTRRNVMTTAGTALVGGTLALSSGAWADDVTPPQQLTVPATQSVLVLGSNGGTGRECVKAALRAKRPCIATTRSGNFVGLSSPPPSADAKLATAAIDVRSMDQLRDVIGSTQPGAVLFAASASSSRQRNAFEIDRDGVINAAKACIELGVSRYVVVSSGTVTRPDAAVYQLLNTVGQGIMEAKIAGEDAVRAMYADPHVMKRGLGYTIVRPGGLTNEDEPAMPSILELNQGDTKSGRLSRASVAELCVQCLESADTWDTTFECYEKETAKSIESVGLSNILKSKKPTAVQLGRERQGDSWPSLFAGLERDVRS